MQSNRRRPTPGFVLGLIALAVALGGTAWAATKIDTGDIKSKAVTSKKLDTAAVTAKKIADNAVTSAKIADNAVTSAKIADGAVTSAKLADGAVTGAKVADNSLNDTKISDYEVIGGSFILATATEGANEAAARAAAPEIPLFTKGQLSLYAKCYRDAGANTTFGTIYSRTTADGSIQQGLDNLPGGNTAAEFLNTNTLEDDREVSEENATGNDADISEAESAVASPDGTGLMVDTYNAAKNGTLAGGEGLYGTGNKCVFGGTVEG